MVRYWTKLVYLKLACFSKISAVFCVARDINIYYIVITRALGLHGVYYTLSPRASVQYTPCMQYRDYV